MVLGEITAAAMGLASTGAGNWDMGGMLAGLGTSGRGAKVDQKFQKIFANIDYKIQRQSLHRDDIRDLVDLTVSRMDMYNVVGALILTFSLQWVCDNSVVSAEKESVAFPRWFSTVFIIQCFSSAGYLLFSLWFSMHCSIVSKAEGTKLLLHFARLTIPNRDEINKQKVRFYSTGLLGRMAERLSEGPAAQAQEGSDSRISRDVYRPSPQHQRMPDEESGDSSDDAGTCHHMGEPSIGGEIEDDNYKNDSDFDFQRHLRMWVKERGKWLSYDAYSRVCMVVGMNQLLQAMSYNLLAGLSGVSYTSSFLCVLVAKILSLHIYRIDVEMASCMQTSIWFVCDFMPPLLAIPLLMLMPPDDSAAAEVPDTGWAALWAIPIFLLHSAWTFYLAGMIKETKDKSGQPSVGDCPGSDTETHGSVSSSEETLEDGDRGFSAAARCTHERHDGLDNLPKAFLGRHFVGRNARSLYQVFKLDKYWIPGEDWFDHTPAKIVRSFTLALAGGWILAGVLHTAASLWWVSHSAAAIERISEQPLSVSWPPPSSLFEVTALHCSGGSDLLVGGVFATYRATLTPNASLEHFQQVGGSVAAVLCGAEAEACDALTKQGDAWSLVPLEELCARPGLAGGVPRPGAAPEPVPIPTSWRIVAGAWTGQGAHRQGLLVGWDGDSIDVSTLQRDPASGSWLVQPWFRVNPRIGRCDAGKAVCPTWRSQRYDEVAALQLSPSGRGLSVLTRRGFLDAWQLQEGALVGRWRLGLNCTAMCHDHSQLYVSHVGKDGPVLSTAPLPEPLAATERLATEEAGSPSARPLLL